MARHPSSSTACKLSDAVVLENERDLWLFLRGSGSDRYLPVPIPLSGPLGTYRREEPKRDSICTPIRSSA